MWHIIYKAKDVDVNDYYVDEYNMEEMAEKNGIDYIEASLYHYLIGLYEYDEIEEDIDLDGDEPFVYIGKEVITRQDDNWGEWDEDYEILYGHLADDCYVDEEDLEYTYEEI